MAENMYSITGTVDVPKEGSPDEIEKQKWKIENIPESHILMSNTFKNLLGDIEDEDNPEFSVPILNYDKDTIVKIFEYINHLKTNSESFCNMSIEEYSQQPEIMEVENSFKIEEMETYCKMVDASDFLDIPIITESLSKRIANIIKGKEPEEIRALFDIEDDLTEEEKAQINDELNVINTVE